MKAIVLSCAVVVSLAGAASADLTAEAARFAGSHRFSVLASEAPRGGVRGVPAPAVIYDNLGPSATFNAGFVSTDLTATFGDHVTTLGTGVLQEMSLTVFNSNAGGNVGILSGGTVAVDIYRGSDGSRIGGFSGNFDLSADPLDAGFFTILTFTDLGAMGINLDTTDIVVTQTMTAVTGTTDRLGVVSAQPLLAGTTAVPQLYIEASTVNGGAAGFYNITSGGNPITFTAGYTMAVVPAPGAFALLGASGLFAARRRR